MDPISALSHEAEGPKSNTNPLDDEEEDCVEEELESASLASDSEPLWHLETELGSPFDLFSGSLSLLVSGFV